MAKSRWLPPVALCVILFFISHEFIYGVEERSLFVYDLFWLKDFLNKPSGILSCCSLFFTQFLHIPWLGALIWVAFLLITYKLTIRALRIPDTLSPLALIPVALLVIYNMSLGYGVYIMREQDHFFAPMLGYITALLPLLAVRNIKPVWGKILLIVVWTVAGFPLLGTFTFVGTLSASCFMLVEQEQSKRYRFNFSVGEGTDIANFKTGIDFIGGFGID